MHPAYFEVRFRAEDPPHAWPSHFVILTAYATTGSSWPSEVNAEADRRLRETLRSRGREAWRVTGYAPGSGHAEPGWACALSFDEACDLGVAFEQDALYLVEGDSLFVSHCDARRAPVRVGSFRERLEGGVS